MKTAIVGYTGFVGSNLCMQHHFDACYNSKNICEAFGTAPDLLVYAGIKAEMFLANKFPEKDLEIIEEAMENIRRISPKRVVLISTIAVYDCTYGVDEDTSINKEASTAYGRNRRILEEWVEYHFEHHLIVRLPGIYGVNMKKNFLYDMINIIPSMLTERKYRELSEHSSVLKNSYQLQENGFARCLVLDEDARHNLKNEFLNIGFTALQFTDSRGIFQYFNLKYLWWVIETALEKNLSLLNVATEPVTPQEIYEYVYVGNSFCNEMDKPLPHFDFHSLYAALFNADGGYIMDKRFCLEDIKQFIESQHYKSER